MNTFKFLTWFGRLLVVVASCCQQCQATELSPEYLDFKRFLNTDDPQYEFVFSVTSGINAELEKKLNQRNQDTKGVFKLESTPVFYRVQRSVSGFSLLESPDIDALGRGEGLMKGVASNMFFFVTEQSIIRDESLLPRLQTQGATWTNLADEAVQEALTLGLWVKKGSIIWNSNSFTAETPNCSPIPKDKRGQRLVTGNLLTTNGIPERVNYQYGSNRYTVRYSYSKSPSAEFSLPAKIDITEEYLAGGTSNELSIGLISYIGKGDSAAIALPGTNDMQRSVAHISRSGAASWANLKGGDTKTAKSQDSRVTFVRFAVVGGLIASTLLFAWLIFFRKSGST